VTAQDRDLLAARLEYLVGLRAAADQGNPHGPGRAWRHWLDADGWPELRHYDPARPADAAEEFDLAEAPWAAAYAFAAEAFNRLPELAAGVRRLLAEAPERSPK
jgi:hypothetical protein